MALELRDCSFHGPALPEPFVKFQLERELSKRNLLAKTTGAEGRALEDRWDVLRRKLRQLGEQGGDRRVANHVLEPLVERLAYSGLERQAEVITREGAEDGGWLFTTAEGQRLRAWTVSLGTDLDAPNRRGRAYRFSPSRVAQRVLLASGERMGLLSDGEELRILLCDPARPDSHISIRLDRAGGWRAARALPDSYRLLLALASPAGVAALPDLTEAARLAQSSVTKKLRLQARRAIEGFLQEVLEHPANAQALAERSDRQQLAQQLWGEGLITVYRLLFVFKLESSADPARAFSFAATSLWRNTYSPNTALADLVRRVLDEGKESGGFLEAGLRTLWRLFAEGMSSSELEIKPLGGMLFGRDATPLLDQLQWGEQAVARLLDALLWTPGEGVSMRERVHYGALDVEDLGRVYESLLELEPGISSEPMCRLRRAKLEVVVPVTQGDAYRSNPAQTSDSEETGEDEEEGDEEEPAPTKGRATSGSKTKVEFIEEIAADRFFLRVGLGRKASGSYYTPHPFVRFLVQETLGVLLAECSPRDNPQPALILKLKVLDAAMGSGHFLVEACRFLGEGLYEACRLCDELAVQAEEAAEKTEGTEREMLLAKAAELRQRVEGLPDPNNELLAYLPSRVAEGEESGLSQKKAEAMCRRLVAVHCLYGVDKNPLAVELAKLSLWLESYAEGLPLTFLDHRLICGDSLTGPFFKHLLTYPTSGKPLDDLFAQNLSQRLEDTLAAALVHVRDLEASVGKDLADLQQKESAKAKLDKALAPLRTLAAAWSGAAMVIDESTDDEYRLLVERVLAGDDISSSVNDSSKANQMISQGVSAVSYPLVFPEVFNGYPGTTNGFHAVLGNPPWDKLRIERRDFMAGLNPIFMGGKELAGVGNEHDFLEDAFLNSSIARSYQESIESGKRASLRVAPSSGLASEIARSTSDPDLYRLFLLRCRELLDEKSGFLGYIVGGGIAKVPADTSLRLWLFESFSVRTFAHYLNLRQLFGGASSRISFACIVATRHQSDPSPFMALECTHFEHLISRTKGGVFDRSEILTGLRRDGDLTKVFHQSESSVSVRSSINALEGLELFGLAPGADIHRTNDKSSLAKLEDFTPGEADARPYMISSQLRQKGALPLYSGRSMRDYDYLPLDKSGKWDPLVSEVALFNTPRISRLASSLCHFRFAWRATCGLVATNERSARAAVLPPGSVAGDSLRVEQRPYSRANWKALAALGTFNSYAFDFAARRVVQSNLNLGVLKTLPWPCLNDLHKRYLAHASLRLSALDAHYQPLWIEQFGNAWREPGPKFTWPVLQDHDCRWKVRGAIDAVIAQAYGLERTEYEAILSSFNNRSYPRASDLCMEAFIELSSIGLEAFFCKHDPYWDIPLNDNLPPPVISLSDLDHAGASLGPLFNRESGASIEHDPRPNNPAASSEFVRNSLTVSAAPSTSTNGALTTIAELLRSRGVITSSDAQQATGLDAAGVRPYLQQLVQQGLAVTEGQRRGMRYRRVDG